MSDLDRAAHLKTLGETPARLKAALKGVPKKMLLWTPGPGKWSILEIVAHMRDMERDAYIGRYRRILAEDNPLLPDIDGDVLATQNDYRGMNLGELMREWTKLRKESIKLLKHVKVAQWTREGTHATAGPLSMTDMLRRHAVGNDEAHLGQIESIKKRAVIFETLETGPKRFATLFKSLDDVASRKKPAPEKWSAVEVAYHMRDIERLWADRIVKAVYAEKPAFYPLPVDEMAVNNKYNTLDPVIAIKEFARLREDTLRLLRSLPSTQWKRAGIHPKRGEITIERIVEIMIGHDAQHLEQAKASAA